MTSACLQVGGRYAKTRARVSVMLFDQVRQIWDARTRDSLSEIARTVLLWQLSQKRSHISKANNISSCRIRMGRSCRRAHRS